MRARRLQNRTAAILYLVSLCLLWGAAPALRHQAWAAELLPGGGDTTPPEAPAACLPLAVESLFSGNCPENGPCGAVQVSDDGTRFVFAAPDNPLGLNPDGNVELFLYDTIADLLWQLTQTTGDAHDHPEDFDISGDGTTIALSSEADLTGENPDLSREIFLLDVPQVPNPWWIPLYEELTSGQVTGPGKGSRSPSLNVDGTIVAFHSTTDLTGENPDGEHEIFLYDAMTAEISQVTNSDSARSWRPRINADGTRMVFSSESPNGCSAWEAEPGDGGLFFYDLTTQELRLIAGGFSLGYSIDASGRFVTFAYTHILGQSLLSGLYLFDAEQQLPGPCAESTLIVGSPTPQAFREPSISQDGRRVAFLSDYDLTFQGLSGRHLFLVDFETFFDPTSVKSEPILIGAADTRVATDGDGTHVATFRITYSRGIGPMYSLDLAHCEEPTDDETREKDWGEWEEWPQLPYGDLSRLSK